MPQPPALTGLHHITAITGDPAANVRFYAGPLGLRLVKKTVNQDDVSAYHLFYGDELGRAGTELTFFHWPHLGPNVPGPGTIARISLGVPAGAIGWWAERFGRLGVEHDGISEHRGRPALRFTDPEGQRLELVDSGDAATLPGRPWAGSDVPPEMAIRGLYGATLDIATPRPTVALLTGALGFRQVDHVEEKDGTAITTFETGGGGPGREVQVAVHGTYRRGVQGLGGVHHVAFRVPDDEGHAAWHDHLREAGVSRTPIIDRFYFKSIYFREPGGVLFELATDGPGFATDEEATHLGERLSLPPFLEPHRAEIEAGLTPLPTGGERRHA